MDGDASAAQPGTSEAVSKLIPPQAEAWGTGGTANPSGVLGPKARRGGAGSRPRRDATRRATVSSRQCGLPRLERDICGMMRPLLAHVARDRGHLGRAHRLRPEAELPGQPARGGALAVPRVARPSLQPTHELGNRELRRMARNNVRMVGCASCSKDRAAYIASQTLEPSAKPIVGLLG